jgi:hypothetical protein
MNDDEQHEQAYEDRAFAMAVAEEIETIGRRTAVVGIFPNDAALVRLAEMLCIEQNDEWLVGRAYLSAESISEVVAASEQNSQNPRREKGRNINQKEKE